MGVGHEIVADHSREITVDGKKINYLSALLVGMGLSGESQHLFRVGTEIYS